MKYVTPIFLYQDTFVGLNARIEDYVIRNPKCKRVDISKALEILPNHVSSTLSKLALQGRVRRVRTNGDKGDWVWEPGAEKGWIPLDFPDFGQPKRSFVSTWEPCKLQDPLIVALFGMYNVERRS